MLKKGKWNRLLKIGTVGALAGMFVVPINPVHSTFYNLAFLGCVVATWVGITILVWKRKPLRYGALILLLLVATPFLLPGRGVDAASLSDDYVHRMTEFEGTPYHWGGENSRGIDCSGFPRRALRDALLASGIRTLNGRCFRLWAEQWWFDASAKALSEGYRGYTTPIGNTGTIEQMNDENLIPGDLAVTTSGVHILAYVGNGKWIQADPGIGAVKTLDGRSDDNVWFRTPVTTHRWQLLNQ
ncbi:MAG: NlpC/P60 family protein [Verrucomicrobiales bacterium]|nr:NlpC/P60 family protein [Verrucomicrobiales bacterium]